MGLHRAQRTRTARSFLLGLTLTLLVVLADRAGALSDLEYWLYDQRARHFQHFTPRPTDRLIHLDIDDGAVETIGRWPWPRTTLANIIDEVRLAGAEAMSMDVILP